MKRPLRYLTAACLYSMALAADADTLFYLGLDVGQASQDLKVSDFDDFDDGSLSNKSVDDTDTSYGLIVGYQHTPYLSFEAGFIDFGKISFDATSDGGGPGNTFLGHLVYFVGPVSVATDTDGWTIALKGQVPVNDAINITGKVGRLNWSSSLALSNNSSAFYQATEEGGDLFYGAGVAFDVGKNTLINVNYNAYSLDDIEVNINVISLGVQFNI